jgi:monoamine oxidase
MPRTPLARQLRSFFAAQAQSARTGLPIDDLDSANNSSVSRRDFLKRSSVAVAALAASPILSAAKKPAPGAKIVVVGAGLAGLTCAYRLKQAGADVRVYEANTRVGGRCWTRRGDFLEGQIAEHGGELIDQSHASIRHLAQELKLPLDNLLAAEANGAEPFFYFGGGRYTYAEANRDVKGIWQKIHRDLSDAGYPTQYNRYTQRGLQLDRMSIIDWINETVPGGVASRLGQLLNVAYNIEYGAECEDQSALNLLYLLGYNSPGQFNLFGASNEKYHVRGGNDQIVTRLAHALGSRITTGASLVAVTKTAAGAYRLSFQSGSSAFEVNADKVVFALPFSILRHSVDLSRAGLSALKLTAIDELGMGSNSKLNVQFNRRHWVSLGNNGDTFSSTGYQASWEVSRAQAGTAGILVGYSGGNYADTFASGSAAHHAAQFISKIEPVLPGIGATFNGRATVNAWRADPFTRGSYAYFKVGQYTRFAGIEGVQEGNAHFCGEHTSVDSQGYLNGAVETGERAAAEVLADLR